MMRGFVFIATRGKTSRLYTGVTGALTPWRIHGARLVWYEECSSLPEARRRAGDIRRWNRACKRAVIERANPGWKDLSAS
jgi:putative endonuclease